jgi:hypothetical protein
LLGEFGNEQRNVPNDTRTPSLWSVVAQFETESTFTILL